MDVLQKEIDEVYATQLIADEILDNGVVEQHQRFIHSLTEINGGCAVISDLSNRKSYIAVHPWAHFLGLTPEEAALSVIDSMDEDCIYRRIHPEDLVEKRLLEYQFFQKTFSMSSEERLKYRGRCRIRMMNEKGVYQYIDNLVQIMENTPSGSVWLIFVFIPCLQINERSRGYIPLLPIWNVERSKRSFFRKNIAISYPNAKRKYFAVYVKDYLVKKLQLPFILV